MKVYYDLKTTTNKNFRLLRNYVGLMIITEYI